ncbi:MAG: MlaD family protein [Flavobacteriales bacterium]|nr:MlaD family protein [Flavobacteriales bacterium]
MKYSKEIKTAVVALATIFAFVWGYNFLKGNDIFSKQRVFYTILDDAGGLNTSAPIMANGFKVGLVKSIYFEPENRRKLVVELMLTADNFDIPKGTKARLVSDLFGTTSINLKLGEDVAHYEVGDTLGSEIEESLTAELANVSKSLIPLKVKAETLIQNLDSLVLDLRDALGKGERGSAVNRALADLAVTMENLKHATGKIDVLVSDDGDLGRILSDVEAFTSVLDKNKGEIDRLVSNLASFSDSLAAADIASTINNANRTFSELAIAMEQINSGQGTVGKLLKDDSVYNNLTAATDNLDKLFIDIKARPSRYVHVSLFGKKNKD